MILDIYSILPLTCALFVLFFGIFILSKDWKSKMNQMLFAFCITMLIWMFSTFMMFALRNSAEASLFWDRMVYMGVVWMPPFMHHFSLLFTKSDDKKQKKLLYLNYAIAFFFFTVSRTNFFVEDLYYFSWGVHAQARILHHFFLGFFFLGTSLFFINLLSYYRKVNKRVIKIQITYIFLSFAIVIFIGGLAYLHAYNIDTKFPFSYLTGIIFPVILFYAVTKHHALGMKTVVTEVLAGVTNFLVVLQIFLSDDILEIILRSIFAILILFISILLIRSVNKEVDRRRKITILAKTLEKANLRLQEVDRQKTEFLSIASHQLRTPLSIAKGYIELLEDGAYGKVNKEMKKILEGMNDSNEHLVKLVDDFLDISRIEQGRTKYSFQDGDLNKVVTGVVEELKERARENGIKIIYKKPKLKNIINIDEEKIRHVIFNFIDNAIKYSGKGKEIVVNIVREKKGLSLRIKDGGLGFDEVDQANFFQKFYRGNNVRGTNVAGTGLGLYVCRRFIEKHDGRIWADSKGEGKGSEFGFWISDNIKHDNAEREQLL